MKVTKARSLAKAVMYRGLGTASTFLIAWAFTGGSHDSNWNSHPRVLRKDRSLLFL